MSSDKSRTGSNETGVAAAIGAFAFWGFVPVFWKALHDISTYELIAHRAVWTLAFLLVILGMQGRLRQLRDALASPRLVRLHLLSAALITINWLIYVWAVNSGQIVEASLGYFLNPLLNVVLGFFLLRERLRPVQWLAVGLAGGGVAVQLMGAGRLPWIALVLAGSFGFYGLLRKQGPLGSLTGLAVETTLISPVAVGFLVWSAATGRGALGHVGAGQHALIFGTGIITAVPLLMFATAARSLSLATLGIFQYIAPSMKLLLGVYVYGEPFGGDRVLSFALIWTGLIIYSADSLRRVRRREPVVPTPSGPTPMPPTVS